MLQVKRQQPWVISVALVLVGGLTIALFVKVVSFREYLGAMVLLQIPGLFEAAKPSRTKSATRGMSSSGKASPSRFSSPGSPPTSSASSGESARGSGGASSSTACEEEETNSKAS